jgi:hypothetical protein
MSESKHLPTPELGRSVAKKNAEAPKTKISKTEAVRRAVDEGITKPQEGVEWIVANFGEELRMPPGQFSSYKSQMKLKASGGVRRAGSAPTASGVEAARQVNKLIKAYDLETVQSVAAVLYQHDSKTFRQALDFIEELHKQ